MMDGDEQQIVAEAERAARLYRANNEYLLARAEAAERETRCPSAGVAQMTEGTA